jgi:uncharacterized membrane protein YqiK
MTITLPSRYQNPLQRQADMTQEMIDLANIIQQINLALAPLTNVVFSDFEVSADVQIIGSVLIKDDSGNIRKLAVIS